MEEEKNKEDTRHTENKGKNSRCKFYLSLITLNGSRLDTLIKRQIWQSDFLKMIQIYSVYKSHTSDSKTKVGLK